MSKNLINLTPDLKKLRNEGYEVEVRNTYLLIHSIPYVNSKKTIVHGTLVCVLNLAGNQVVQTNDHTVHFIGDLPCDKNGVPLTGLVNNSNSNTLEKGLDVDHYFSAKPKGGKYCDYYEKITTYIAIIGGHAQVIDSDVTAKTFKPMKSEDHDTPFRYFDTNSSRADIQVISEKLKGLKIAIIGLGGTGSYVLDFVAKTPVKEIHLFDEDGFLSHNAFRAPGAISIEMLRQQPKKVLHFHSVYDQMHNCVIPHDYHLTEKNLDELKDMSFVFICIDESVIKKAMIERLITFNIPFVDVGIGINTGNGSLSGLIRVTAVTQDKDDHVNKRISFSNREGDDYSKNIQIAELNALNASLAVIKWKKFFGFYHDLGKEHNVVYDISMNNLINDEIIS